MNQEILGIHHVTAIAKEPQKNLDFYTGFLGLRLVKLTVNFDDPQTYHFYYGDQLGQPGTLITFFVWTDAPKGRQGTEQVTIISFAIPQRSLGYWIERLLKYHIDFEKPQERFGESVLAFKDPDGLLLELVAIPNAHQHLPWSESAVPPEHAIRGLYTVMLCEDRDELTAQLLTQTLGFRCWQQEGNVFRYTIGEGGSGKLVDLRCVPDFWTGAIAQGTVHHVAWRVHEQQQQTWQQALRERGFNVTPILDRQYFHSVYFTLPGGIIFELATDAPGFTINESLEQLGTHLMLPQWLEKKRKVLEKKLPQLRLPHSTSNLIGGSSTQELQLGFAHCFIPAQTPSLPTLLLLHGTGGNETDLLCLGQELFPGAALLCPRGKVLQNGMSRFFRCLAEGVFDPEDLKFRTNELAGFVETAAAAYGFDLDQAIAVGYSHGANIAVSMLLLDLEVLKAAILFRPMPPIEPQKLPRLGGIPILIVAGREDLIISLDQTEKLVKLLQAAGADVNLHISSSGNDLSSEDLQVAKDWLQQFRGEG